MRLDRCLAAGFDRFLAVPRTVAASLILLGIGLNFANVVGRYVFSAPIPWAEEAMVVGMIWIIFLGAALAERDNEHLRIDLLPAMLPPRVRKVHHVIVVAIVLAVCGFSAWQSFGVTQLFANLGDESAVAGIPKWAMHGAVTVGLVLVVLGAVAALRARIVGDAIAAGRGHGGPPPDGGDSNSAPDGGDLDSAPDGGNSESAPDGGDSDSAPDGGGSGRAPDDPSSSGKQG